MKAKGQASRRRAALLSRPGKWRWLLGAAVLAALAAGLLLAAGQGTVAQQAGPADVGLGAAASAAVAPPPMAQDSTASASRPALSEDGPTAPDFSIVTTNGKTFRLSEQRGKAVVVNFNATG